MQPCDRSPYIMQILRSSFHDGDGLRTVVYFKGCPLRCIWCHNPEGQDPLPEIFYYDYKCIKCGRCIDACKCHTVAGDQMLFDRANCRRCGKCATICPSGPLSLCGEKMSPEKLYDRIKRDARYYDRTGGGVTFSGGEALLYPDYLTDVLVLCKNDGINTAIESAMHVDRAAIDKVLDCVDAWMVDIKHTDPEEHKRLTGKDNRRILENIKYLASKAAERGVSVIARTPLIPGLNDSSENLIRTAEIALESGCKAWQILKYNNLGQSKYAQLGSKALFDSVPQTNEAIKELVVNINSRLGKDFAIFKS